jgi:hypothetical protein
MASERIRRLAIRPRARISALSGGERARVRLSGDIDELRQQHRIISGPGGWPDGAGWQVISKRSTAGRTTWLRQLAAAGCPPPDPHSRLDPVSVPAPLVPRQDRRSRHRAGCSRLIAGTANAWLQHQLTAGDTTSSRWSWFVSVNLALAGEAALAFALGVAFGALLRRTLPAIGAALAGFVVLLLGARPAWEVRPH